MKQIETSTEIAAPAGRVWEILVDVDRWHEWNPFAESVTGELRVGNRVEVKMRNGIAGRAMSIKPDITAFEPGRQLRWVGGLLHPKLMRGEHHFVIEPIGEDRCRFLHGEDFTGALIAVIGPILLRGAAGYQDMSDALKARAEA